LVASGHVSAQDHQPLAGMIVLALDNEPRILDGMRVLLSGWGCDVVATSDVAESERQLTMRNLAPHAIIADYHLDGDDGISAIAQLRRVFGADIPALLVTADRTKDVQELAESNDIRILNKPLKPAALRAVLSQWRVLRRAAE
jgi:CheY-like chemotaxis protein